MYLTEYFNWTIIGYFVKFFRFLFIFVLLFRLFCGHFLFCFRCFCGAFRLFYDLLTNKGKMVTSCIQASGNWLMIFLRFFPIGNSNYYKWVIRIINHFLYSSLLWIFVNNPRNIKIFLVNFFSCIFRSHYFFLFVVLLNWIEI